MGGHISSAAFVFRSCSLCFYLLGSVLFCEDVTGCGKNSGNGGDPRGVCGLGGYNDSFRGRRIHNLRRCFGDDTQFFQGRTLHKLNVRQSKGLFPVCVAVRGHAPEYIAIACAIVIHIVVEGDGIADFCPERRCFCAKIRNIQFNDVAVFRGGYSTFRNGIYLFIAGIVAFCTVRGFAEMPVARIG